MEKEGSKRGHCLRRPPLPAAFPAQNALADVPPDAGEVVDAEDLEPIWIFDEQGELLKFVIADNDVRGYRKGNVPVEMTIDGLEFPDGELDPDEVIAFRAVQLGISWLWPEEIPNRADLAVAWTDPSPVMKGIMEYRLFAKYCG